MNLVIVESPAKCGKIQGFLGPGFKVIASMGHIRALKETLDSVGIERDFEPTFEFMKDKASTISSLKSAASNARTVYLASDDDREGELIAYSVCLLLKLNPATTLRSVFHEITQSAVKQAIENPRRLDMNKVYAAEVRAMLDMMIGFTMSPLLWKNVGPSLSAGRCQTAALRLVCEREDLILSFESSDSWKISGTWAKYGTTSSSSSSSSNNTWDAVLTDELEDEDSAQAYLQIHHDQLYGKIVSAETSPWSEKPPLPLITSTLQQQASSIFMSKPKQTMNTAQRLYESGYITYMRTDKALLSEEATLAARDYVSSTYGENYVGKSNKSPEPKTKIKTTAKAKAETQTKTQDAHEAIRPISMTMTSLPTTEDWSAIDRKIYHLIWMRTIQSVMASVKGEQRTLIIVADGDNEEDFTWRASWRITIFDGWRKIQIKERSEDDQEEEKEAEEKEWEMACSLVKGMKVQWKTMNAAPHTTRAKQHFNEANLIHELESQGIGRPSTFASLVSTILDRQYVETKNFPSHSVTTKKLQIEPKQWPPNIEIINKEVGGEKNRLAPTPLGKSVLQFLLTHFDDLFQFTFTSQMESRLDKIAEGQEAWKMVLKDTWNTYKDRYTDLFKQAASVSSERRRILGDYIAVIGKKGPLLLKESADGDKDKTIFYGWPDSIGFQELTLEQAISFAESAAKGSQGDVIGTLEDKPIIKKNGKFGCYAMWNGKTVSCKDEDTLETLTEKFSNQSSKSIGVFEIRTGPYGLYMFKKNVTKRSFVSIPSSVNLDTVTEAELVTIFQNGLKQKAKASGFRGGRRGK